MISFQVNDKLRHVLNDILRAPDYTILSIITTSAIMLYVGTVILEREAI